MNFWTPSDDTYVELHNCLVAMKARESFQRHFSIPANNALARDNYAILLKMKESEPSLVHSFLPKRRKTRRTAILSRTQARYMIPIIEWSVLQYHLSEII